MSLHRADLTAFERNQQLAEWVQLTTKKLEDEGKDKLPQLGAVSKGGRGNEGDARAAQRELGVSKGAVHRADLTALYRDEQVAEWVSLVDGESGEVAQVAPLKKPGMGAGSTGGVRSAARDLDIDRTDARRAVKVASITPEAKAAIVAFNLDDNRSAMLAGVWITWFTKSYVTPGLHISILSRDSQTHG